MTHRLQSLGSEPVAVKDKKAPRALGPGAPFFVARGTRFSARPRETSAPRSASGLEITPDSFMAARDRGLFAVSAVGFSQPATSRPNRGEPHDATPCTKRMIEDLELAGCSEGTQDAYVGSVRSWPSPTENPPTTSMQKSFVATPSISRIGLIEARWPMPRNCICHGYA